MYLIMKLKATRLLFVFTSLILSCKEPTETTEKPFIKAISFVGIHDGNVDFNAEKSRITIKLPAVLEGGLQPIMALSEGAEVVEGVTDENTIDLTSLCACSNDAKPITLRLANEVASSVYEIVVIPDGPLKAQNNNESFTFTRKGDWVELSLPVENLYTRPKVTALSFTNLATGQEELVNADAACLNRCYSTEPNRIIFSLTNPIQNHLKPGNTYRIAFNNIKFPQHLVVTE
jgi:hypothetical protein